MLTTVIDYCKIIQIKTQVQQLNLKTQVQQLNLKTQVQQLNLKTQVQWVLNLSFFTIELEIFTIELDFFSVKKAIELHRRKCTISQSPLRMVQQSMIESLLYSFTIGRIVLAILLPETFVILLEKKENVDLC